MATVDIKGDGETPTSGSGLLGGTMSLFGDPENQTLGDSVPLTAVNDNYLRPLQSLMPRGPIWPRAEGYEQTDLNRAASWTFTRADRRAKQLLIEANPSRANEMLSAWEEALGLSADGTIDERRDALVAKLRGHADPNETNILAIARALGYLDATIKTYDPYVAGSESGLPDYDPDWRFRFDLVRLTRGTEADVKLAEAIDAVAPRHTYHGHIDSFSAWRERVVTGDWLACARAPGPVWVIAGTSGSIKTSSNLRDWTSQTAAGGFVDSFNCAAYGAGVIVLMGDNAEIQTSSDDGVTWTQRSAGGGYAGNFFGVRYSNGLFVAVGGGGEIQTSPNGVTWTHRNAGASFTDTFYSVAWSSDFEKWFIGGFGSEVQTSPDGITWTSLGPVGSGNLYGMAAGGGVVMAVGNTSGAFRSRDGGATWDNPSINGQTIMAEMVYSQIDGVFIVSIKDDPSGFTSFGRSADGGDTWYQFIDDDQTVECEGSFCDDAGTAIFVSANRVFTCVRDDVIT